MKVIRNKDTGRLVWREDPEPKEVGLLLQSAIVNGFEDYTDNPLGDFSNLEEYEATQEEWDAEIALRLSERPKSELQLLQEKVAQLDERLKALEPKPTP